MNQMWLLLGKPREALKKVEVLQILFQNPTKKVVQSPQIPFLPLKFPISSSNLHPLVRHRTGFGLAVSIYKLLPLTHLHGSIPRIYTVVARTWIAAIRVLRAVCMHKVIAMILGVGKLLRE
jgi:hypothetical protein